MKLLMVQKALWFKACQWDSIDPLNIFVVWSDNNPWMFYYNLLTEFMTWRG